MPGYHRPRTVYQLRFEDEPELEITTRPVSIDDLIEVGKLGDELTSVGKVEDVKAATDALLQKLAGSLIGWNLEEGDDENGWTPVPATLDGLKRQDLFLQLKIVTAWTQAVMGAIAPLAAAFSGVTGTPPEPRTGTPNPLEATIPMSPMSPQASESAPGT